MAPHAMKRFAKTYASKPDKSCIRTYGFRVGFHSTDYGVYQDLGAIFDPTSGYARSDPVDDFARPAAIFGQPPKYN
jgi:hypothetical protein